MKNDIEDYKNKIWTCGQCGYRNDIHLNICKNCNKVFDGELSIQNMNNSINKNKVLNQKKHKIDFRWSIRYLSLISLIIGIILSIILLFSIEIKNENFNTIILFPSVICVTYAILLFLILFIKSIFSTFAMDFTLILKIIFLPLTLSMLFVLSSLPILLLFNSLIAILFIPINIYSLLILYFILLLLLISLIIVVKNKKIVKPILLKNFGIFNTDKYKFITISIINYIIALDIMRLFSGINNYEALFFDNHAAIEYILLLITIPLKMFLFYSDLFEDLLDG